MILCSAAQHRGAVDVYGFDPGTKLGGVGDRLVEHAEVHNHHANRLGELRNIVDRGDGYARFG